MGPRDVGRETRPGSACVDQQRPGPRRALALLVLVVQHGRVPVEGDDVAVGQGLFALAGGALVLEVDLELARAGSEGRGSRAALRCVW